MHSNEPKTLYEENKFEDTIEHNAENIDYRITLNKRRLRCQIFGYFGKRS